MPRAKPERTSWLTEVKKMLTALAGSVSSSPPQLASPDLADEDQKQHVYLVDFGIAQRSHPGMAHDPFPLGSRSYASPEQYSGTRCTPRSDIYSFGVLLYQMLTAELPDRQPLPFKPPSQLNTNIPLALEQLLQQMLESEPQRRPSASDVKKVLELINSWFGHFQGG